MVVPGQNRAVGVGGETRIVWGELGRLEHHDFELLGLTAYGVSLGLTDPVVRFYEPKEGGREKKR